MDTLNSKFEKFQESYWNNLAVRGLKKEINPVICNWIHYIIGNEKNLIKGFDGIKFKITYFDGNIIYTNNLWHQGTIPDAYHHLFTNNVASVIGLYLL